MAMKIKEKDNFSLIKVDAGHTIPDLVLKLENLLKNQYSSSNIAVDLLKYNNLTEPDILAFTHLSGAHKKNKKSFVLINDSIDIDLIPEELTVVPTLIEAGDIIEMEEIERDLGF